LILIIAEVFSLQPLYASAGVFVFGAFGAGLKEKLRAQRRKGGKGGFLRECVFIYKVADKASFLGRTEEKRKRGKELPRRRATVRLLSQGNRGTPLPLFFSFPSVRQTLPRPTSFSPLSS